MEASPSYGERAEPACGPLIHLQPANDHKSAQEQPLATAERCPLLSLYQACLFSDSSVHQHRPHRRHENHSSRWYARFRKLPCQGPRRGHSHFKPHPSRKPHCDTKLFYLTRLCEHWWPSQPLGQPWRGQDHHCKHRRIEP